MAGFHLSIRMTPDFFRAADQLVTNIHDAVERAVYQEAETEMTMAKERTPVDTGALRSSGRVEYPEWIGRDTLLIRLAYGGPALEYALRVHEDTNVYHKVGRSKFLESVVREETGSGRAQMRIESRIRRMIGA